MQNLIWWVSTNYLLNIFMLDIQKVIGILGCCNLQPHLHVSMRHVSGSTMIGRLRYSEKRQLRWTGGPHTCPVKTTGGSRINKSGAKKKRPSPSHMPLRLPRPLHAPVRNCEDAPVCCIYYYYF